MNKVGRTLWLQNDAWSHEGRKDKCRKTKIGRKVWKINSEIQTKRQNVTDLSSNPKVYNAKYFGRNIYYDQNEKLRMFGIFHVCARDGFSSEIAGHATMT